MWDLEKLNLKKQQQQKTIVIQSQSTKPPQRKKTRLEVLRGTRNCYCIDWLQSLMQQLIVQQETFSELFVPNSSTNFAIF